MKNYAVHNPDNMWTVSFWHIFHIRLLNKKIEKGIVEIVEISENINALFFFTNRYHIIK